MVIEFYCEKYDRDKILCDKQCKTCRLADEASKEADEKLSQIFKDIVEEGVKEFYGLKTMLHLTMLCAEEEEKYETAQVLKDLKEDL